MSPQSLLNRTYLLVALTMVIGLLTIVVVGLGKQVQPVAASGPCDQVAAAPDPPIGDPVPEISGTVIDTSSGSVEGATIKLYGCSGATAVYVTSDTTDTSGNYAFTNLTSERWYYVEAVMTGPLYGKTPSGGTENPTDPIGLGDSQTDINFSFQ